MKLKLKLVALLFSSSFMVSCGSSAKSECDTLAKLGEAVAMKMIGKMKMTPAMSKAMAESRAKNKAAGMKVCMAATPEKRALMLKMLKNM